MLERRIEHPSFKIGDDAGTLTVRRPNEGRRQRRLAQPTSSPHVNCRGHGRQDRPDRRSHYSGRLIA